MLDPHRIRLVWEAVVGPSGPPLMVTASGDMLTLAAGGRRAYMARDVGVQTIAKALAGLQHPDEQWIGYRYRCCE